MEPVPRDWGRRPPSAYREGMATAPVPDPADFLAVDADLGAEERDIRDAVRDYAAAELEPRIAEWYESNTLPREIAKGLGKRTVAEFVPDDETVRLLLRHGVDLGQGYHLGKPRPLSEVVEGTPGPAPASLRR